MPWIVKQSSECPPDKPWGVFNQKTGRKVACHATESSAKSQQKALYANVPESRKMGELISYVKPMRFAEFKDNLLWLEALPAREYQTMQYGEVVVTPDKLNNFVKNFHNNVRGQEIATDYEHGLDVSKGNKASGWMREVEVRGDSLWLGIEPTPTAKKEIEDDEWKYFSLDWEDLWPDNDGLIHRDVIVGGGFTNRPIAKNIMPINFSELYDEKEGGKLDTEVKNEHAAEEHAEPGGGEPDPQTNPDDSAGDRHLTVPGNSDKVDEEGRPQTNTKEDDVNENEKDLDAKLRETLGLAEDADIVKAVDDLKEEVGPLREVAKQFSETKKFSEAFPEQARELAEMRRERLESKAIKFSEEVGQVKIGPEGKHQFSQLVLEKIANTHKKFSEGSGTVVDLEDLLKSIGDDKAIIEIGERGTREEDKSITFRETDNPRMAFSEAVKSVMNEDNLEYDAAVKVAGEKYPELAEAYFRTTVRA